jgi:hypothetical protein
VPVTELPSLPAIAIAAADRPGTETRPADVDATAGIAAGPPGPTWRRVRAALTAAWRAAPRGSYAVTSGLPPVGSAAVAPAAD